MVRNRARRRGVESESEGGFTLVEFLIASLIMSMVLGGTVALATKIQEGYQYQLDDEVVEQEARYALDWISRDLRSADSDPFGVIATNQGITLDPNGGGDPNDSIRVRADINQPAPDGDIADSGENVTIALDAVNRVITRADTNVAAGAVAMTDAVFTDLNFTYLNAARAVTATPDLVAYIQVQVTARSRGRNRNSPTAGGISTGTTFTLGTEVRVRTH